MEDYKFLAEMEKLKRLQLDIDYIDKLQISDMAKAAAICELETQRETIKKEMKEYISSL